MDERFKHSVDVNAPAALCFQQWSQFEEFPRFMDHVKSVRVIGDKTHWVVDGPMGKQLEWDAVIDAFEPNKAISWHTIGEPDVGVQGAVVFDELTPESCRVTCTMQYQPPAGVAGAAVANLFANPGQMVQQDLENFKKLIESSGRGTADIGEEGRIRTDIYTGTPVQNDSQVFTGGQQGSTGSTY